MKKRSICFGVAVALFICSAIVAVARAGEPAAPIPSPKGWKLVWNDEFDGKTLDKTKWDYELGNSIIIDGGKTKIPGWGNNELEYYTDREENVFVNDGMLHLKAIKENFQNCKYTSGRIKTRKDDKTPLFKKLYGRYEFRAKLPTGKGVWPAIWLLPQDETYKAWAASGEIDIMEARGQEPTKVVGTLHYGSGWPANVHTGRYFVFPEKATIADFHVYALEWEPGEIRWYVDDKLYQTQNFWWSSSLRKAGGGAKPEKEADLNPWPAPFDQPFYLILNVAVGGQFLGNPDATTVFPAEMVVDYVRVFDKIGGYEKTSPRGEGKLPVKSTETRG